MNKLLIRLLFLFGIAGSASAATLNVPATYASIDLAHAAAAAGDTILVTGPFTNATAVTITIDGNSSAWVNFVAVTNAGKVVVPKFAFSAANYVRLINFEITHYGSTAYGQGITFGGACSNIQLIDNYIHETRFEAIQTLTGSSPSYITLRGNRGDYFGYSDAEGMNWISGVFITPHHWLMEYNHITRFVDLFSQYGTNMTMRNNWAYWIDTGLWAIIPHPDMFQSGSDGGVSGTAFHNYERNFVGRSTNEHSHFGILQDNQNGGDTNVMIRGNVAFAFGGGAVGMYGVDRVLVHNNTIVNNNMNDTGAGLMVAYGVASVGTGILANNLIQNDGGGTDAINIEAQHAFKNTHNWGYQAGVESSYLGTSDPLLNSTNGTTLDLRPSVSSPLLAKGTNLVWATEDTTGTSFDVNDAVLLSDGWGIAEGDVVVIGATTTRVTLSDWTNNVIHVADSVTVTNTQPIWWGRLGGQKDLGGYPYGAEFLTAATYTRAGNDYTITPTGHGRFAWVYVDGIPKTKVYDPIGGPWTVTEAGNVTAIKVYAEWAQSEPVVLATEAAEGEGGDPIPLTNKGRTTRFGGIIP
jgi:hypothetical protein